MKSLSSVLVLSLLTLVVNTVPDEVMQKFKENVQHEQAVNKEDDETEPEYIESHRFDVPALKEQEKTREDKEKGHGRDDFN